MWQLPHLRMKGFTAGHVQGVMAIFELAGAMCNSTILHAGEEQSSDGAPAAPDR
jgi:hypothetical protein